MREQVDLGIVEPEAQLEFEKFGRVHYLPHQAVIRRNAATSTKVHIVYDALIIQGDEIEFIFTNDEIEFIY